MSTQLDLLNLYKEYQEWATEKHVAELREYSAQPPKTIHGIGSGITGVLGVSNHYYGPAPSKEASTLENFMRWLETRSK